MTAPTSPGVVPADVWKLAMDAELDIRLNADHPTDIIIRAIMADRANRPSLTEDERNKPLLDALRTISGSSLRRVGYGATDMDWVPDCSAREAMNIALRALADRSEPRQEKEGDRG